MTARCPACKGTGQRHKVPCDVCAGSKRIVLLSADEAKLAAVWMAPAQVAAMKAAQ
jgi:DnaJ-class molecular chaperone